VSTVKGLADALGAHAKSTLSFHSAASWQSAISDWEESLSPRSDPVAAETSEQEGSAVARGGGAVAVSGGAAGATVAAVGRVVDGVRGSGAGSRKVGGIAEEEPDAGGQERLSPTGSWVSAAGLAVRWGVWGGSGGYVWIELAHAKAASPDHLNWALFGDRRGTLNPKP
jgi:hypothetical protein